MESEFFLNAGIPPPSLHFEPTSSSPMPPWQSLSSALEMQANESSDCFLNPTWEKSTDQAHHFDSSPAASNSNISTDSYMIRELIGKLGNIGNNNSGEISPHSQPMLAASYNINPTPTTANTEANNGTNTSCYSTPLNSPPKLNLHPLSSTVAEFTADPGFAERAAKFSCFGSRSFNGRTTQIGLNNSEFPYKCNNPLMGTPKLPRVSSSPSLKAIGSQKGNKNSNSPLPDRTELANSSSPQGSSVSEQTPNESNPRKRKSFPKGKPKESRQPNSAKDPETDDSNAKRSKGDEKTSAKTKEEQKGNGDDKQNKANSKPPEPPKDYIHVRARRGQATDSHSLAERVRREKISERMKLLQDLVPGCNKVTGKALMLDEIINYVQSLQRQVEFLSMKLASVNTRLDINMDTLISKDIFQSTNPLAHPIFPVDSSASAIFGHQPQQNPPLQTNISNGTLTECSMDPSDTAICQQLASLEGFNHCGPQFPTFYQGDLHTIVQMGFAQNQANNFTGVNHVSHMKTEP